MANKIIIHNLFFSFFVKLKKNGGVISLHTVQSGGQFIYSAILVGKSQCPDDLILNIYYIIEAINLFNKLKFTILDQKSSLNIFKNVKKKAK